MQRRPGRVPAGADSVQDHGCDRLFLHTRPVCCFFCNSICRAGLLLALQPQKNRSVLFGPGILKKRYMLICGNGILVYSFSTLTALLLDWIIGAAFHGMTGILAAQSLLAWFVEQLAFIAMYQVALVAVMLTGNILTALLGCAVFFSYELAVRFLIDELKTIFCQLLQCRCKTVDAKSYLTPFAGFWDLLNHIWYRDEGRLCSYKKCRRLGQGCGGRMYFLLLACAAAAGLFAFWLYRRRKTESYEHAIAFAPLKGILEAAMAVPFGIAVGMIISRVAANKGLFLFAVAAL